MGVYVGAGIGTAVGAGIGTAVGDGADGATSVHALVILTLELYELVQPAQPRRSLPSVGAVRLWPLEVTRAPEHEPLRGPHARHHTPVSKETQGLEWEELRGPYTRHHTHTSVDKEET